MTDTPTTPPDAGIVREWKCGNEFLPYHPQASHVSPDYRDGWNACYDAARKAATPPEVANGLKWIDHPTEFRVYWLADAAGKILAEVGSVRISGGGAWYAVVGKTRLPNDYTTPGNAKLAAEAAVSAEGAEDRKALASQGAQDLLALQRFANAVMGEFPDHGDIDGATLQEIAESCGLLKQETKSAPCGEVCACAECGVEGETLCYRVQPVLSRARRVLATPTCGQSCNCLTQCGDVYAHELEGLRADAVRLDFIEKNARCDPKMDGQHVWWPTNFNKALKGPTLRAAIDAARAAGGAA